MTHKEGAARRREIAKRVRGGANPNDLAVEFGVCANTVIGACREYRVKGPYRPHVHRVPHRSFSILFALLGGRQSQGAIASKHRVSRQAVNDIAKRASLVGFKIPSMESAGHPKRIKKAKKKGKRR